MAYTPTVLYPLTLPGLLNHILTTQSAATPTTLIVCSTRDAFLKAVLHALEDEDHHPPDVLGQVITPTLHSLLTARHVKIAFCTSVQGLLAYLTSYSRPAARQGIAEGQGSERLVLVNPLALHAPTPSFSAQGLSRTFAAATETALRLDAKLLIVECDRMWRDPQFDAEREEVDGMVRDDAGEASHASESEDAWEQEVPILNVSARRYGGGSGERSWAGRTVKVRRIAERWFQFRRVDDQGGQD